MVQDIPNITDLVKGDTAMPERVFNRILVATLGRPWSVHALELAVRLAKADGLELVVVAVLTPGYVPEKHAAWGIALSAGVGQDMKALAEHVLETARSLAEANGLTYVCEMRKGRAADEILKAAEEHKCDVIVIGSRGLSGITRVTMGETGNEVVLKAPMPVIVVK
jgi:nucleotide-binding universal stress UspA family protein